jgi:hypothetical protein
VDEYSMNPGYDIQIQNTSALCTTSKSMDWTFKEAIEIELP